MINLKEFIEEHYDVRDRIKDLRRDPISEVANSDIFPYDFIGYDNVNNEYVKMLYYADGDKEISVIDLISYFREDLVKKGDNDLINLYDVYMSEFTENGTNAINIQKLSHIREVYMEDSSKRVA